MFLHEVAEGAAGRSWGVHVAQLAGVPAPVVRRAARPAGGAGKARRPADRGRRRCRCSPPPRRTPRPNTAPTPTGRRDPLRAALAALDPDRLTPREALEALYRLQAL